MKIKELVEKYNKNNYLDLSKTLEVKKYLPIMKKYEIAQQVFAYSTSFENGLVKVDSLKKYLFFTITAMINYTNLEFSNEDEDGVSAIDEYDMLAENGLVDKIIECYADDYARSLSVLNDVFADEINNNNTIESILADLATNIGYSIDDLIDVIKKKIESMDSNIDLSNLNFDNLTDIMSLFGANNK